MQIINKYYLFSPLLKAVFLCFILAISCKSTEKFKENPEKSSYEFNCSGSDYVATADYFRVHKIGESVDQATSMRKAIQKGQEAIAVSIKTKLEKSIEKYLTIQNLQNDDFLKKQVNTLTSEVSDELIEKVNIICEESILTKNGMYKTSIVLELSANEVLNGLQKEISNNTQFQIKINTAEFKRLFEQEMEKKLNVPIN